MENVVTNLKKNLDYDNNYYFYHETGTGIGEQICNEGLYLTGENILEVKNLLLTTASPITKELTDDNKSFTDFLRLEKQITPNREVTEMVIIGVPKENMEFAVDPISFDNHPDLGAKYILDPSYILGYVDLVNEELIKNENYFDRDNPIAY